MKPYTFGVFISLLAAAALGGCSPAGAALKVPETVGETISQGDSDQNTSFEEGTMSLEPFTGLEIETVSEEIRFELGEEYGVRYRLSKGSSIRTAEAADGIFTFTLEKVPGSSSSGGELTVILPEEAELEKVSLASVSGNVEFDREADELLIAGVSGDCLISGTVRKEANVASVAGRFIFSGEAESLGYSGVSGYCEISGKVSGQIDAETVSGNITVSAEDPDVQAASMGGTVLDGVSSGNKCRREGKGCRLRLASVSGNIEIETSGHDIV